MITEENGHGLIFVKHAHLKKTPFEPDALIAIEDPDLAFKILRANQDKEMPKHEVIYTY